MLATDVYISEVHFGPQFGDPLTQQYLEVRGTPQATVANDIYFLSVESKQSSNPGKINSIFNLSGLTFGANGFLAFLQQDHGFSTVGPVFVGTQGGFKGMPGSIYSGNTGQFESITGSESFLVVDTSQGTAPFLAQDIDTNDDGVVDGLGWIVTDSVTYFKDGLISDDVAYGDIVFRGAGNTSVTVPGGATIVEMNKLGYVARIGSSTGHAKSDWVGGGTKELITPFVFEISDGDNSGEPSPGYFAGKTLTHIGSENFVSSISGSGPVDATIYVDRNDNDNIDGFQTIAEPDDLPPSSQLINAFDGVTLTGAGTDHEPTGFSITSKSGGANASTGSYVFAYSGIVQFSDLFQLRMDFLRPTEEVSIDFRAEGTAIGVLKAFDADDNLLQTYTTGQLPDAELQTMTIAQPNISYAVAFVDAASPSPSGYLDNLRFVQQEESAIVALDGKYTIEPVSKKDNVLLVKHLGTGETEAVRKNDLSATGVDLSGDPAAVDEIFGRTTTDGSLYVARPNASLLSFEDWGVFYDGVEWDDILVADVNGDGLDDVVGRTSGQWWVAQSNGSGFTNSLWGRWADILWEDVQVGDIDGDGTDDIVGRTSGQWWVARSTGTYFNIEYWGAWSNAVTWDDVQVGDFNGDQKADITGRTGGQWWVSLSQGTYFSVKYWGSWSNAVTWNDVTIGDYNGDGKSDIAGRTSGQWWVSLSQDTYFSVSYWGSWSNAVTWVDVSAADLNGDGQTDLVGRTSGQWWAARSTGNGSFSIEYWGSWSDAVTWNHVVIADLDGDTMDDIIGRTGGSWWASMSKGGSFSSRYWGNWTDSQNWTSVSSGGFGSA